MEKPVVYLLTRGGITEVLLRPAFIEIISRDEDVFNDDNDPLKEPLDRSARIELQIRNDEFEFRFKKLLNACRKLTCNKDSLRDEGLAEISGVIDAFDHF